jgi:protein-disulfide isomerase
MTEENQEVKEKVSGNRFNIDTLRSNPWMVATIVLALVLVGTLLFGNSTVGNVGSQEAGENLVDFLNSQATVSGVELESVSEKNGLYEVTVQYQGSSVPVYVTTDGKYFTTALDPLVAQVGTGGTTTTTAGSPSVQSVNIEGAPVKGQKSASVTVVEYSDYYCSFCARHSRNTLPLIEENYIDTGKINYVVKHFDRGAGTGPAEAALCVRELGGDISYYKYHDILFENQQSLSKANLIKWAQELGFEIEDCLDSGRYQSQIAEETLEGQSNGVTGTPGFLVGNEDEGYTLVSGAHSFNVFEQVIEGYLN